MREYRPSNKITAHLAAPKWQVTALKPINYQLLPLSVDEDATETIGQSDRDRVRQLRGVNYKSSPNRSVRCRRTGFPCGSWHSMSRACMKASSPHFARSHNRKMKYSLLPYPSFSHAAILRGFNISYLFS